MSHLGASTTIKVDAKRLLMQKDMKFYAALNGTVELVLHELMTAEPDIDYVDQLLATRLLVDFPDYVGKGKVATVVGGKFEFICGAKSQFRDFLPKYCYMVGIHYEIEEVKS